MSDMVTMWFTGAVTRFCNCGTDELPVKPCDPIYTDGKTEFVHCNFCGKTWDVATGKERFSDSPKKTDPDPYTYTGV